MPMSRSVWPKPCGRWRSSTWSSRAWTGTTSRTAVRDLRAQGVDILTLGQYLRPSDQHLPIARYYTPGEFAELRRLGMAMGYRHVEAGPLVRSSYHAWEQVERATAASSPSVRPT